MITLAAFVLLTFPAAAVTISNPAYPGDTQAQAEMLKGLGLFRGTEKGFELGRSLQRDEAAALLVRYLGAEDKVLAGNWKHPFTDVPVWADKYVGWLYQSGLAKGVGAKRYGAAQAVTCAQYATFLSRAATGEDAYEGVVASADEVAACDRAGFTRGDAVQLSARMLSGIYTRYGNSMTMAQFLIDKGAFTKEQLKTAAWDVLPRAYMAAPERADGGTPEMRYVLECVIAGVPVVRNTETEVTPVLSEQQLNQVYGTSQAQDGKTVLYQIDPRTLKPTEIGRYAAGTFIGVIGEAGGYDYLLCGDTVTQVQGGTARALDVKFDRLNGAAEVSGGDFHAFSTDGGICVIDADGVRVIARPSDEKPYAWIGGRLITQAVSSERTTVNSLKADGTVVDTYTVHNDSMSDSADVRLHYAPTLLNHNSVYLWGEAGLYRMQDGRLTQLTARAALDYGYDSADGSFVFVSHGAGKRVPYSASAVEFLAGDEIVRLRADGTVQVLLADTPAHGMLIDKITYATGGRVEFASLVSTEPRRMGTFTCALENGRVRVLGQTADITWIYGEGASRDEQERLNGLGIGVGG
ncbi:MAG: S-layer homology domain-containing protein [Intestinibacillus sp.]